MNSINTLRIVIPTCNQYVNLIEGLQYTINKFFPSHGPVDIIGYESPTFTLDRDFTFYSYGKQIGPNQWSGDLIKYLKKIEDEYIMYFTDDSLMTRSADESQIEYLYQVIKKENDIGKVHLMGSLTSRFGITEPTSDYLQNTLLVSQDSNYRTSLQPSIWKKEYLLKNLKENQSPWDFEKSFPKNDNVKLLTTKYNHPMMFSHIYRKGGVLQKEWFKSIHEKTQLTESDIQIIKKMLKLP